MCEIHTMVSEIADNVDLLLGVKNCVETEGEISMGELKYKFLYRSVPIFPVHKEMIMPKDRRDAKAEVPFLDEILELGIIKLLGSNT